MTAGAAADVHQEHDRHPQQHPLAWQHTTEQLRLIEERQRRGGTPEDRRRYGRDRRDASSGNALQQLPLHLSMTSTVQPQPQHPPSTATMMSEMVEPISIEEVLLYKRWTIHCMSQLYHFHHRELSQYAHELVKFLRDAALQSHGRAFGYSVSIRFSHNFVVFHVDEDQRTMHKSSVSQNRAGGFVLYFPDPSDVRRPRFHRHQKEPQYVLLLRGNEELMLVACQWLQRRFQCVINKHVVRISIFNLERLARNWTIETLLDEEQGPEDGDNAAHAPLVLKYQSDAAHLVHDYRMLLPWNTMRRIFQSTKGRQSLNPAPEVIALARAQFFDDHDGYAFDHSQFRLTGFELQDVALDACGSIEFFSMSLVHIALHSLLELFCVQKVMGPAKPEITL